MFVCSVMKKNRKSFLLFGRNYWMRVKSNFENETSMLRYNRIRDKSNKFAETGIHTQLLVCLRCIQIIPPIRYRNNPYRFTAVSNRVLIHPGRQFVTLRSAVSSLTVTPCAPCATLPRNPTKTTATQAHVHTLNSVNEPVPIAISWAGGKEC